MYAADALQAAIYQALNGHVGAAVYDYVPPGTPYPYVVIGHLTEVPDDLHDREGSDVTATLHIWSDATGTKEVNDILAAMDAALHHRRLTVDGAHCWAVVREFTEVLRDQDVETGRPLRHAVARYRFGLEAI